MIHLPGRHNIENVMAAILAARECGCDPRGDHPAPWRASAASPTGSNTPARKTASASTTIPREPTSGRSCGRWRASPQPVVLLLGGRDKEGDFETLAPLIRERVREMVLFGEAREKINGLIGGVVKTTLAATLKEAVEAAWKIGVARRRRPPLPGLRELRRIHGLQGAGAAVPGMVRTDFTSDETSGTGKETGSDPPAGHAAPGDHRDGDDLQLQLHPRHGAVPRRAVLSQEAALLPRPRAS